MQVQEFYTTFSTWNVHGLPSSMSGVLFSALSEQFEKVVPAAKSARSMLTPKSIICNDGLHVLNMVDASVAFASIEALKDCVFSANAKCHKRLNENRQ